MTFWSDGKQRTTTDTYTGEPFRWNDVVLVGSVRTVAKSSRRAGVEMWLDPSRVPAELLRELNPELLTLLGVA